MPGPAVSLGPTRGSLRWARGGCVGLATTGLAAGGHVLAHGMLPAPGQLAALLLGSVAVATALSGRRWRLPSLLTVLLGAQVALHVGFAHGPHHAVRDAAAGPSLAMVAAHVVAAVLTAVLLRRGEDWCWALVGLLSTPWRAARLTVAPVPHAPSARPIAPTLRSTAERLASCLARRGPPAPVAV